MPTEPDQFEPNRFELVTFDLETTGLYPVSGQIVELGAVRFRPDGTVVGEFRQLINPRMPIPAETIDIHGITDQMVREAPTIVDVLPSFVEFLGPTDNVLLAHNARFDVEFLSVAATRHGVALPAHQILDTCPLARTRLSLPNYRLATIGRHLELASRGSHRALDDSLLLKDVALHLLNQSPRIEGRESLLSSAPVYWFRELSASQRRVPTRLRIVQRAIASQQPVLMQYRGGSMPGRPRRVTPRMLVELRDTVYLVALCHESNMEKTYRLDRIRSCRLCPPSFQ